MKLRAMFTKCLSFLTVSSFAFAGAMFSAPLENTRGLPPEGNFILHIDADAFRTTAGGKLSLQSMEAVIPKTDTAAVEKAVAEKFIAAVSDVTIGGKDSGELGVCIIRGTFSQEQANSLMKAIAADTKTEKNGGRDCFIGTVKGQPGTMQEDDNFVHAAFIPAGGKSLLLVVSDPSRDAAAKALKKALENYDAGRSMPIPATLKNIKGTPTILASIRPSYKETAGNPAIRNSLSQSLFPKEFTGVKEVYCSLSEMQDDIVFDLTGVCESAAIAKERAQQIDQLIGMVAISVAMLPEEKGPGLRTIQDILANRIAPVATKGTDYNLVIRVPSASLIKLLKTNTAKNEKKSEN